MMNIKDRPLIHIFFFYLVSIALIVALRKSLPPQTF